MAKKIDQLVRRHQANVQKLQKATADVETSAKEIADFHAIPPADPKPLKSANKKAEPQPAE